MSKYDITTTIPTHSHCEWVVFYVCCWGLAFDPGTEVQKRHLYTWLYLGECSNLLMMSNIIYFRGFTTCHTRLLWCFGWTCARCRLTFYFYLTSAIKTVITLFLQIDTTFDTNHNLGALSEVNINMPPSNTILVYDVWHVTKHAIKKR